MIKKVIFVFLTAMLLASGERRQTKRDSEVLLAPDDSGHSDDGDVTEVESTIQPHFLSTPVGIEATIGESVEFPCDVDVLDAYVMLWLRPKNRILFVGDNRVTGDTRVTIDEQRKLHISGVQPKDSGSYICQISTNPPIELTHTLNVLYPPTVKPRPKSGLVTAKEGEKVTLSCDAMGNPDPTISWKHMGRHYDSTNGKDFVFPSVQKSDSGEYECIANNDVGEPASETITLEVVSAPRIYPQPEDGLVTVKEGETVSISCEATGDPTPEITWKKPGGEKAHTTRENGKIIITEANRGHAGTYECIANNSLGIFTSFEIKVQVLYPPEIVVPIQGLHAGEGTTVELTCIIQAEPAPAVSWKHGEKVLHSSEHYHIKSSGHNHILQIRHMREHDFGLYECSARNSLSSTAATIDVMGTPQVPSFTSKPHGSQGRRYTLQWMVKSHSPIEEYRLMYKKKAPGEEWISVNVPANEADEEGNLKTQTYQLTDLEPGTKYEAAVSAHNKFGWSKQSDSFDFTTKNEVLPTRTTVEPTMAAAVVEEGMSDSNDMSPPGDGSERFGVSTLLVVVQVLALCILRPFLQ